PCHLTLRVPPDQRKDYGQTLLKLQNDFHAEDCLGRLKELEEQGRIWGQDVILEVKDQELVLSDVESKDELEAFPLGSVKGCSAGLDNAVLAVSVQERNPPRTSVLLFQCERLGVSPEGGKTGAAPGMGSDGRVKGGPFSQCLSSWLSPPILPHPMNTTLPPHPGAQPPSHPSYSIPMGPTPPPHPRPPLRDGPGSPRAAAPHLLSSVLRECPQSGSHPRECVTRVGITPLCPILGGLLHLGPLQVLGHCPSPGLAPAVQSPLLLPEALQFLEENLGDDDYGVWKSLGTAWNKSRAEYPNSDRVPAYTPVFLDGWLPPVMEQERRGDLQDTPAPASVSPAQSRHPSRSLPPSECPPFPTPAEGRSRIWALMQPLPTPRSPLPAQGLVRALYDFQARNSQELSVRKGDTLQVLDQQRKWWLVQDERGDRGHVPGNILEPLPEPGHRQSPTLHPNSSPAEVTAWLMDKGFSRITVRTLGVLRGHELLQMSPAELRGVCPEEWRRHTGNGWTWGQTHPSTSCLAPQGREPPPREP
uniref:EPS8 signaling adaptor L3 n=1 Tax=Serinus canaria TaxID=9135 RepID=A0A8C9KWC5_SERCA